MVPTEPSTDRVTALIIEMSMWLTAGSSKSSMVDGPPWSVDELVASVS
jgi:hypothetical protein